MLRLVVTYVLILTAVACPCICRLTCCAAADNHQQAVKACCPHCQPVESSGTPSKKPLVPRSGMSCFCGGAVVGVTPNIMMFDMEPSLLDVCLTDDVLLSTLEVDCRREASAVDHLQALSGRSVRIWIASLVI